MDCTHFVTFLLCSKPVVRQALWAGCKPSIHLKVTLDRRTPPTKPKPPAAPPAGRIHRPRSVVTRGHRGPTTARRSGGTGRNGRRPGGRIGRYRTNANAKPSQCLAPTVW